MPSRAFLTTVIFLLVGMIIFDQYLIWNYEEITDKLLATVDQLLNALSIQMGGSHR